MAEYVILMGAEQVQSAASTMSSAAHEMNRAAAEMRHAFEMHQRFLAQWLLDFQTVLETVKEPA